jgi:hypothetical protein
MAKTPRETREAFEANSRTFTPGKVLSFMLDTAGRHHGGAVDAFDDLHLLHRRMNELHAVAAAKTVEHFKSLDQAMRSGSRENLQRVIDEARAYWQTLPAP